MKLLELETEQTVNREELAAQLRELADSLARHNEISFKREGLQYRVKVPNDVNVEVEIEIGEDGTSLEIEMSW
ncbi:MAG: amphi-Trp domain-containing protein [Acidimicrobiales bacterium]|nr:amphi-Trp domain-containing protein [Acidimicrobiales bacterium]